MEEWNREIDSDNFVVYYKKKEFNNIIYKLAITIEESSKSIKYWVGLSSGNKRKDLLILEDKNKKIPSNIKPLIWAKNLILEFPEFYNKRLYYPTDKNKQKIIVIGWSDTRRKNIYSRLKSEGFILSNIHSTRVLIKKIK